MKCVVSIDTECTGVSLLRGISFGVSMKIARSADVVFLSRLDSDVEQQLLLVALLLVLTVAGLHREVGEVEL